MSSINLKPTYYFGNKSVFEARDHIKSNNYKKALILYGGGSVKKNGSYDDLIKLFKEIKLNYVEFGGIEPNPRNTTLDKCIKFVKDENVDVIFAIGGGSVVDASKVISIVVTNNVYKESWEYVLDQSKVINKALDIISIITLAGTASENNSGSVITNNSTNEKLGVFTPTAIPTISIEDPNYTFTVNKWQTASGIFDCFSHLMEQFLGNDTFTWTKNYIVANIKTLIEHAKKVVEEPTNYDSRANVLWTSTMALNGFAAFESDSDWSVHTIEHAFSGLWDITHGAGLAFITPTYLKIKAKKDKKFESKLIELGSECFNTNGINETINFLVKFIKSIYLPTKWSDFEEIKEFTPKHVEFLVDHSSKYNYSNNDEDLFREVITELSKLV